MTPGTEPCALAWLDRRRWGSHAGEMTSSFHQEKRDIVVAHSRSWSRAEFVQTTLAAHGIPAVLEASAIYPSVDFVEGRAIAVAMEHAERAREILATLGLSDDPEPLG